MKWPLNFEDILKSRIRKTFLKDMIEHEVQASKKNYKKAATNSNNENAVKATFEGALLMARNEEIHTMAEWLILLVIKMVV